MFARVESYLYNVDSDKLERVQKKILRAVEFKFSHSHRKCDYSWIMDKMGILPLTIRRRVFDPRDLRRLINGNIDSSYLLNCLSFLLPAAHSRTTRNKFNFTSESKWRKYCNRVSPPTLYFYVFSTFHDPTILRNKSPVFVCSPVRLSICPSVCRRRFLLDR